MTTFTQHNYVMTVKYVVLVLSKTISVALSMFITPESTGTAKYRKIINSFFDCLCVCSLTKWRRKIKSHISYKTKQDL